MWKRYTNLLPALICALLIGCASSPGGDGDSGTKVAIPADVDSSTMAAYKTALNAMQNGRDDTAIAQFSAITQTHPNLAGAFINLGILYINKGRYEDAEKVLLQATTIKPGDAVAQTHLGLTYRHLGKFNEATQAYDVALKSDPKYPFAHLNAGILYDIYLSDLPRALNHYQQYQALTNGKDKLVDKWIVDLERRVKAKS